MVTYYTPGLEGRMGIGAVIAGAGPVGLMLAGELALGGVDAVVCEQRTTPSGESRGIGFTRRAAECFDQRGLLARLGESETGDAGHFGGVHIDMRRLEDNHAGVRGVPQYRIEAMLEAWVRELGVPVLRGHKLTGFRETADGVVAEVERPGGRTELRASYLVGCDGGRSTVRRLAGIEFPGRPATRSMYIADIAGCDIRPRVIGERVPGGMIMAIRLEEGVSRIIIHPDVLPPRDPSTLTFTEIADSWQSLTGQSIHDAGVKWMSSFTDAARQATEYQRGRILLVGDAAHIHLPAGAQGLSLGVQDAVNVGWKLAATINGWAPSGLLGTYQEERHPVGARVVRNTLAQAALYLAGDEMDPLRTVLGELVAYPEVAHHLIGMVSGLDVHYDMGPQPRGAGHPLTGFRISPDWELRRTDGSRVRVAELLHRARGVLVHTAEPGDGESPGEVGQLATGWSDRVGLVTGRWVQPAAGWRRADRLDARPESALIRPDGYVAWAGTGTSGLLDALSRWFGRARDASRPRPLEPQEVA